MSETDWTADILGQRVFDEAGSEILPTVNEWQLFGLEGTYNAQTNRLELRAAGAFDWQESVQAASLVNFASTRVGNVLTAIGNGVLTIDGINPTVGKRVLLKNQSAGANNGLMDVIDAGSASTPAVLQRSALADETGEITPGLTVQVEEGTQGGQYWYVTNIGDIVINSTVITFALAFDPNSTVTSSAGSSTDNEMVRFDATTGRLIQGSPAVLSDGGNLAITGATAVTALDIDDGVSATVSGAGRGKLIYDDTAKSFKVSVDGGAYAAIAGSGDVTGPASAVDNRLVTFDTATGKLIQDDSLIIALLGSVTIDVTATTPIVSQAVTAIASGQPLLINAQDTSFASATGGAMTLRAGNASGGTSIGGAIDIRPGSGTSTDGVLTLSDGGGTARATITSAGEITFNGNSFVAFSVAGNSKFSLTATVAELNLPTFHFRSIVVAPELIQQTDSTTPGAPVVGDLFTLHSQDVDGVEAFARTGGALDIRAGDATNGSTNTGGALDIRPGAGATANGALTLSDGGGIARVTISATGSTTFDSASTMTFQTAVQPRLQLLATVFQLFVPTIQFADNVVTPVIKQLNRSVAAGQPLVIGAQSSSFAGGNGGALTAGGGDTTGTGTKTGGRALWKGGDATGGTDTGGDADMQGGLGDAGLLGKVNLRDGNGAAILTGNDKDDYEVFSNNVQRQHDDTVQTTSGVQTVVVFTIPISGDDRISRISFWATGIESGGAAQDAIDHEIRGSFVNDSGTVTQLGTNTDVHLARDDATWSANFNISGTDVQCRVTGDATNNVEWRAVVESSEKDTT